MPRISPASSEVRAHLEKLARQHKNRLRFKTVESSAQGRPIDVAYVTDPASRDEEKQHVLVIAGQHGNEETRE